MPSAAILCDALTRDFGEVRALDELSLSVPAGSIFAFLGPNGAGKTTAIHLLLGLIEPTSGAARVLGLDPRVEGDEIRRHSGALLEHPGLYERLSAADNLRVFARIAHMHPEEIDPRIEALLTRFGLRERRNDAAGTFSRGMKQKLAIARVLLHKPSLVFLDEPTAGLDPEATVALRRDIQSLGEEGTTVFLTTHNLADVEKVATHVAVIQSGRLLDFGTPAELRARAVRSRVIIRGDDFEETHELAPGQKIAPVVAELVAQGKAIEEVRREEPSIEDVFLNLVNRGGTAAAAAPMLPAAEPPPRRRRPPLFHDIGTIVRKELREIASSGSRTGRMINLVATAVFLLVIAAFAAYIGRRLIESPAALGVSWIAFIVLMATVSDSFAGERERHTLETLLASAIPDEALLLGKISANVLYGWGTALLLVFTLLAGASITNFGVFFSPSTLVGLLVLTPLTLIFFSAAGVLMSLHASTVRDAQTRLSALFFGLTIPLVAVRPFLPDHWKTQAIELMRSESGRMQSMLWNVLLFVVLDGVFVALAMARFRRGRLIAK